MQVQHPMPSDTTLQKEMKPNNSNGVEKCKSKRDEELLQLQNVILKTHHYKPSTKLVDYLAYFATLHRFDDRVTYKEAWEEWVKSDEIADLIEDEMERLQSSGYVGNALSKIYKSARYYYRKKPLNAMDNNVEPTEKKKRKKYEGLPADVLSAMDIHIATCIKSHIVTIIQTETGMLQKSSVSPNDAYTQFINTLAEPLSEEMEKKYKKTFKNRFFLYRNKLHK